MPGPGKGRWIRLNTKTAVEDTLKLSIGTVGNPYRAKSTGSLTWYSGEEEAASIRYEILRDAAAAILTLVYHGPDIGSIRLPVLLQSTPARFGGRRWWFTCPLVVNGVPCNRRVGTLYLPARQKYFGCRHCHNLAYRSSQEAHQDQRAFCLLTGGKGFDKRLFKRFMKRMAERSVEYG